MSRKALTKSLIHLIFAIIPLFPATIGSFETYSASAAEAKRDQIKEIESNLSRKREKFREFNDQEKDLLTQLSELEKEVSGERRSLNDLGKKIRLIGANMKGLENKLSQLARKSKNTEQLAARRLVALYKYARRGYFKVLADVTDLGQFGRRLKYLGAIMQEDLNGLSVMEEERREQKKAMDNVRKELFGKDKIKKEAEARLLVLQKDLELKVVRLMKIHQEKKFYETAIKELQLAARNLRQTFLKIEKRETFKVQQSDRFADARGQLLPPFKGKMIKAHGLLGKKGTKPGKGIFIESPSRSEVRAVFPGRVDFSGRLKGYGELIIINHGSHFFTVSARLSKREKREGDLVKAGEVIGVVGRRGSNKGARLYFEIRKGGRNLDPLKWLKLS